MAETIGHVTRITWQAEVACVFFTSTSNQTEILTVEFRASEPSFSAERKRMLLQLLTAALLSRREVRVFHDDLDPIATGIDFLAPNISPVGPAIHNDFYSITGSGIPPNAEIVFESGALSVTVTPDLLRPYWLLVEQLPAAIPAGPCTVFLRAPGWQSDRVPITVFDGALQTVRVLYCGRPSAAPYTFVFAATPAFEALGGGAGADAVLTNRPGYHDIVRHCVENLLTLTESLLREDNLDASVRFVSIFDNTQGATSANALVRAIAPNMIEPVRERMNGFTGRYGEDPDIVFCLTGSTMFTRASAWFTTDDNTKDGVNFIYDGTARTHRRFTDVPGSAALSLLMRTDGLTAIHEFGHAASDFNNGMVIDLYVPGTRTGFVVNKKMRALTTDAVPAGFATYGPTAFQSDQDRDGLGYPSTWASYHPALVDATRPNMMDDYWQAAEPQRCRLDGLTFSWFRDRLRSKILR
jgi:hypothetical protein